MSSELDFSKLHPVMNKMINSGYSREILALGQIIADQRLAQMPDRRRRPGLFSWLHGEFVRESTVKGPSLFDDDCRCAALIMVRYHGNRMGLTDQNLEDIATCTAPDRSNGAFYRAMAERDLRTFMDPAQYRMGLSYQGMPQQYTLA
jgi:hypothetical protein